MDDKTPLSVAASEEKHFKELKLEISKKKRKLEESDAAAVKCERRN